MRPCHPTPACLVNQGPKARYTEQSSPYLCLCSPDSREQTAEGNGDGTAQLLHLPRPRPAWFPGARSSGHGAVAARLLPSTSATAHLEFQGQSVDSGERATPARLPEGKRFPLPQEGTPEGGSSEEVSLLLPLGEPNPHGRNRTRTLRVSGFRSPWVSLIRRSIALPGTPRGSGYRPPGVPGLGSAAPGGQGRSLTGLTGVTYPWSLPPTKGNQ